MVGYCEICGRELRTGRKYCYEHRRFSGNERYSNDKEMQMMLIGFVFLIFASIFFSLKGEGYFFAFIALIIGVLFLFKPFKSLMPESFLPTYMILGRYFVLFILLLIYIFLGFYLYFTAGFGTAFFVGIIILTFMLFLFYKKISEKNKELRRSYSNYKIS